MKLLPLIVLSFFLIGIIGETGLAEIPIEIPEEWKEKAKDPETSVAVVLKGFQGVPLKNYELYIFYEFFAITFLVRRLLAS
jgi:hypothetical protein